MQDILHKIEDCLEGTQAENGNFYEIPYLFFF